MMASAGLTWTPSIVTVERAALPHDFRTTLARGVGCRRRGHRMPVPAFSGEEASRLLDEERPARPLKRRWIGASPRYTEMFDRILIVCTGNICRSPMAVALLRQRLADRGHRVEVRSAGVGAMVHHPADDTTRTLMQAKGLDLSDHRARQVTPELTRWAELILVMESRHRDAIVGMDPTARGKTFLLGHWGGDEIPDPFRREDAVYERALSLIESSLDSWVRRLTHES
jgi:protein-tyrosine phosphatase